MTVKELRIKLELSQQEWATLLGLSLSTVRFWEANRARPSRLGREKLQKFLKQQGIDDEALRRWARIR
jgi:DNA-binding transcriptional regulator YiaG